TAAVLHRVRAGRCWAELPWRPQPVAALRPGRHGGAGLAVLDRGAVFPRRHPTFLSRGHWRVRWPHLRRGEATAALPPPPALRARRSAAGRPVRREEPDRVGMRQFGTGERARELTSERL